MTPLEHYRRAEGLLARAAHRAERIGGYDPVSMGILAHAQVHATLATSPGSGGDSGTSDDQVVL